MAAIISALRDINSSAFTEGVDRIVADYASNYPDSVGAYEWETSFPNLQVSPETSQPPELFTFLKGPDPIHPAQRAEEMHYQPVFLPKYLTVNRSRFDRNLNALMAMGIHCVDLSGITEVEQLQYKKGGEDAWLVVRKDGVLHRGERWGDQKRRIKELNESTGAGYEVEGPLAADMIAFSAIMNKLDKFNEGYLRTRCADRIRLLIRDYPAVLSIWNRHSISLGYDDCIDNVRQDNPGIIAARYFR